MKEIDANREAWSLLAEDHFEHYKKRLENEQILLNRIIREELGDISGKSLIHLQCNTGADTLSLARMGASVTGVDLVPENVRQATKLAAHLGIDSARFIESDIMQFMERHDEQYDIVFTSEGAIGWLPDLEQWGRTIRHLLKEDGFFYVMDSHPIGLLFDEAKLQEDILHIGYPYFKKTPDRDDQIGGYASPSQRADNYFWMYTVGDIINSLSKAGLCIEYFHEFDELFYDMGGMEKAESGFHIYPHFRGKMPFTFSLKATVRK